MKKVILGFALCVAMASANAVVKCAPDGRGGTCCWDTNTDGIFKPITCAV